MVNGLSSENEAFPRAVGRGGFARAVRVGDAVGGRVRAAQRNAPAVQSGPRRGGSLLDQESLRPDGGVLPGLQVVEQMRTRGCTNGVYGWSKFIATKPSVLRVVDVRLLCRKAGSGGIDAVV